MGRLFLLLIFSLLACDSALAEWTVGFERTGPVALGMSLGQINLALGETFRDADGLGPDPTGQCRQVDLTKKRGVALMFVNGHLARVDVEEAGLRTAKGVGVGDPEAAVLRAYGTRLERSPHAYVDAGVYLTTLDASHRHAIRFEIENGKVTKFYAGWAEAIDYIEGCA